MVIVWSSFIVSWSLLVHFSWSFEIHHRTRSHSQLVATTRLFQSSNAAPPRLQQRRSEEISIPLLDGTLEENAASMIQPLPSAHLPDELSTLNIYGMQLTRPAHQMVIDHAISATSDMVFGHVAWKNPENTDDDEWIGAIGCKAQVLVNSPTADGAEPGLAPPKMVLCRGSFRFIVKEIVKTFPFPVAIVEELFDVDEGESEMTIETRAGGMEDEDDEDDYYLDLTPSELLQRTLSAMNEYVVQQEASMTQPLSPLEESILQQTEKDAYLDAQRRATMELAAVWQVFQSSLFDLCTTPCERYYTVAMMAAEMTSMENDLRKTCLVLRNGVQRLRLVLRQLEETVGMTRARQVAGEITSATDETEKELQVGQPTLPAWAKQIRKGIKVEYFWNEEHGWCKGEVLEDPLLVVDELLIRVYFEGDGTTHVLPFTAEEKIRWRPPTSNL